MPGETASVEVPLQLGEVPDPVANKGSLVADRSCSAKHVGGQRTQNPILPAGPPPDTNGPSPLLSRSL